MESLEVISGTSLYLFVFFYFHLADLYSRLSLCIQRYTLCATAVIALYVNIDSVSYTQNL